MSKPVFSLPVIIPTQTTKQLLDEEVNRVLGATWDATIAAASDPTLAQSVANSVAADSVAAQTARDEAVAVTAREFDTVADLLADTSLSVAVNDYVTAAGFTYRVALDTATNHDAITAGGVKLYLVPGDVRAYMPGETTDRVAATDGPLYVLLMGQSNAVGNSPDTTGAAFGANSRVTVWRESTSTFVTPVAGEEPFNVSGSDNAGLNFCNKLAEETQREVRLILIGTGSTSISAWTGSPADRTVSAVNTPRYFELQTAMGLIGEKADAFLWIQGEADGGETTGWYATEFEHLLKKMTVDGYIGAATPVVVSQLHQGARGERGNDASINAVTANANIYGLLQLGDQRLRVANTLGLAIMPDESVEGTQTASTHFTDPGLRDLGRKRLWAAYVMALNGFQAPSDFGLEMSRTERGLVGSHLWHGGRIGFDLDDSAILAIEQLGQMIDVENGMTLVLPDFTHPTKYSSGVKGRKGLCVYFRLIQVGSCTVSVEAGGTSGMVRRGSIYGAGALETSITISAAGAANVNYIHMARWQGTLWDVYQVNA